ncbi:hypothetical protein F5Y00DRAFT_121865 [Daldinia vernicosa]|uniref:uncharacterized protein n=1 Tax=Daldinia vernicosa TaxID=114800 RepID=UPI0020082811|nr:uncharacterized protein F5Y00DRAFT_121865 [Daldinia vernicosa]KAI0847362.1 hypothetical protein F5Y00DRAFT_121865 [Daldinia vernicosa]
MQQPGHRRLSTPTQDLPIPSSNSYRPHFGYPRNPLPLPAAYGYLPQPMWPQEYRPMPGGPRAIPLRMQRATMNRVESQQMPIPSLQLSSTRPYSVPAYLNHRTRSDSNSTFTPHPPRPATSLDLDSVDKSAPSHTILFPQHGVAQNPENDLLPLHATPEDTELLEGALGITRPIANRGSRKPRPASINTAEGSQQELSPAAVPSEQRTIELVEGRKRAASHVDEKSNPSKRIKFNVIRNQSQTAGTLKVSKKVSLANTFDTQPAQAPKTNSTNSNTIMEKVNQPLEESNAKMTMAQCLTTTVDDTGPKLVSNELAKLKAAVAPKPNPYDIINESDLFEGSRSVRTLGDVQSARYFKTTDISTNVDTLGVSRVSSRGLAVNNRDLNTACNQYTSVATQCGISSSPVPSGIQAESGKLAGDSHSDNLHCGAIVTTDDEKVGECCSENLAFQFSRIEEMLYTQNKVGIEKFINMKLNSEGINVLQTLTNELLLGLAVRDVDLLKQMVNIV